MRKLRRLSHQSALLAATAGLLLAVGTSGCDAFATDAADVDTFTIGAKNLLPPELFFDNLHVAVGATEDEPIEQPIAFSHTRHVETLGMDCNYCHSSARKEIHAGVPSTQVCMGCHNLVDTTGRPELEKLKNEYWKDGAAEPIPWVKVHDLPDFVYFSHKRHVVAGVECQECHGPIQEMGVAQRAASLQMGWCLDCHGSHPKIDENYGDQADLRRAELKDCWTCHK